jgi:hypothetical protein
MLQPIAILSENGWPNARMTAKRPITLGFFRAYKIPMFIIIKKTTFGWN